MLVYVYIIVQHTENTENTTNTKQKLWKHRNKQYDSYISDNNSKVNFWTTWSNCIWLKTSMPSNIRPDHPRRVVRGAIWRVPMKIADGSWSMYQQAFATFYAPVTLTLTR